MNSRTAMPALGLLLMAVTACGSGSGEGAAAVGDEAACRAALSRQAKEFAQAGGPPADAEDPAACAGLDDRTLKRVHNEIIGEVVGSDEFREQVEDSLGDPVEGGLPEPTDVIGTPGLDGREDELGELQDEMDAMESALATASP
ncbi:hypothetical protein ABZZ79_35225 [Streptomyces sp. NPDC006458]|uniref:hypothetical protein n=1 Tax=Streptomyces sp. NPDC006458 TaxID=3154302 RepID=UPI0033AE8598